MSDCLAVSIDANGYEFTPSEKGAIHLIEITDTAELRTVMMDESYPAKAVLSKLGIEDFYVKSPMGDSGEIGLHVTQLDAFLDGAYRSPYSVTVTEIVKSYIEGQ